LSVLQLGNETAVTVTVSITLHNTLESIIPQVSAGSIGGINEGCPTTYCTRLTYVGLGLIIYVLYGKHDMVPKHGFAEVMQVN